MIAIYKKELRAYATSVIGYLFVAFILFIIGIYYTAYSLRGANTVFGYTLYGSSFVFLILVPILTMKILAEEKKQKTDQLLLTSPVSIPGIVLGKYLALVTVFLIPLILISFYPVILSAFGTVSFPMAFGTIFGYLLLGGAYLAIGLFISSVTESQVVAAVICFAALLVNYLTQGITSLISSSPIASYLGFTIGILIVMAIIYFMTRNFVIAATVSILLEILMTILYITKIELFENALSTILNSIDITYRFQNFVAGIFDVTAIVYYLTVIFLFVFLTIQSIHKRRWS